MNLHKSHRMGRTMLNGIAKGQTPKLNTGTRRQASDLCPNDRISRRAQWREARAKWKAKYPGRSILQSRLARWKRRVAKAEAEGWSCVGYWRGVVKRYETRLRKQHDSANTEASGGGPLAQPLKSADSRRPLD